MAKIFSSKEWIGLDSLLTSPVEVSAGPEPLIEFRPCHYPNVCFQVVNEACGDESSRVREKSSQVKNKDNFIDSRSLAASFQFALCTDRWWSFQECGQDLR
jgi:hypothetical protein